MGTLSRIPADEQFKSQRRKLIAWGCIVAAVPLIYAFGNMRQPAIALISIMVGVVALTYVRAPREMYIVNGSLVPVALGAPWLSPPLGAAALAISLLRRPREIRGESPRYSAILVASAVIIAAITIFALWQLRPDPATVWWPASPWWTTYGLPTTLVAIAMGSLVNAVFEETAWRIVIADAWPSRQHPIMWALFASAMFGASHLNGTPGGMSGVVLTGAFGASMHLLRRVANGRVFPCIAVHGAADFILFWSLYV